MELSTEMGKMHEGGGLKEDQELGCEMGTDIYTLLRIK